MPRGPKQHSRQAKNLSHLIERLEARDQIEELIQESYVLPETGCRYLEDGIGAKNTDGYVQVYVIGFRNDVRAAKRRVLLHRLVVYARGEDVPKKHNVSHLCGNRACFESSHLVVEEVKVNNSRRGCPGDVFCYEFHHCAYVCPHDPKCIRE